MDPPYEESPGGHVDLLGHGTVVSMKQIGATLVEAT